MDRRGSVVSVLVLGCHAKWQYQASWAVGKSSPYCFIPYRSTPSRQACMAHSFKLFPNMTIQPCAPPTLLFLVVLSTQRGVFSKGLASLGRALTGYGEFLSGTNLTTPTAMSMKMVGMARTTLAAEILCALQRGWGVLIGCSLAARH